jgi:hypothetical protein
MSDGPTQPPSSAAAPSTPPDPKRNVFERPRALAGMIAGIVVFAGGVLGVVEKLTPGGPPPAPAAAIGEPSATPDVALRNYLDNEPGQLNGFLANAKAQGVSTAELRPLLASIGVEATFSVDLSGTVGSVFDVTRNMYSAVGDARVPEAATTVVPPPRFVLHGSPRHFVDSTWIADPPHAGRYLIELVVLDAHGDVLAHKQTNDFTVR